MFKKGNYIVALDSGIFVDHEAGLKVLPGKSVEIDPEFASEKTLNAIRNGFLIEAKTALAPDKKALQGLPADIPAREALAAAGLDLEGVKALDRDALIALKDIGPKTADQILEYLEA